MNVVKRDYHDKTPDLADRLAADIAAALRMGLLFTLTSVRQSMGPTNTDGTKVRYYFEAEVDASSHPVADSIEAARARRAGVGS